MPLYDYLPQRPEKVKFGKSIVNFVLMIIYLLGCIFIPVERDLRKPNIELPTLPNEELGEKLKPISKGIFEQSQKRFNDIQTKAHQMLGFLSLLTPLITTLLVYVWNTFRSMFLFGFLIGGLFITIILLILVLLSIMRCLSVTSIMIPFVEVVFDTEQNKYLDYSPARETQVFLECALYNHVRNDQLAEFVKAAQVFLGLAIGLLILISLIVAAVAIICPSP
ncbi:hypothetical protein MTBGP_06950 [Moorella thermoacetica]|uniref:hypothetical protein n=1 Tax=Neomoorella thermoacetica TaxID=1525 RepID=UPI0030D2CDA1